MLRVSLTSLLLMIAVFALSAGDIARVSVQDIAERTGARLEYDPFLGIGSLHRGNTTLAFAVGSDIVVRDYREEQTISPPVRDIGRVFFHADDAEMIEAVLLPQRRDSDQPVIGAIFIDPGHGGRDPGTIGRHTVDGEALVLQEKDIVLDVSLQVRDLLEQNLPDVPVYLSRETDVYLTLDDRTRMANDIPLGENQYIIYISIHANASLNSRARGFEAWFLPPEQRRVLIDPEDLDADRRSIHAILNSMREEEVSVHSAMLGNELLAAMEGVIGEQSPNRGLKQENWAVVRNALMPSVLFELGFVTNEHEARLLADPAHLRNLSIGLYTGIRNFIEVFETGLTSGT
ncbi:MAG: N-acetylmuramoyl-L-alanine amidase [Spirochaetaceae bacterium]|nr:MAG: N-acetylmuramoyl-L-alanine amidase [Spirochaetaceae bacterium]